MEFEWGPEKEELNQQKHGISFREGSTIFGDPFSVSYFDPKHSDSEDRLITVGISNKDRILVASHTFREDRVRLISVRKATPKERKHYEEEKRH